MNINQINDMEGETKTIYIPCNFVTFRNHIGQFMFSIQRLMADTMRSSITIMFKDYWSLPILPGNDYWWPSPQEKYDNHFVPLVKKIKTMLNITFMPPRHDAWTQKLQITSMFLALSNAKLQYLT